MHEAIDEGAASALRMKSYSSNTPKSQQKARTIRGSAILKRHDT
jgi:hypothetical protein